MKQEGSRQDRLTGMIKRGAAVRITFGPFAGLKATIISTRLNRVVVRVHLPASASVLAEIDDDMFEHEKDRAASSEG
jgi:transcription antitermination factor NusG